MELPAIFSALTLLVVIPVIFVIATHNRLVSKRNQVRNAFSTIDVMLKKRHDLIPNLLESVKEFAAHERDTFEKVIALRNQVTTPNLCDADRFSAEGKIEVGIGRLIAISEDYPDLKSCSHFLNLQRNLTEIEEQISASRRAYNAAAMGINNVVESFPSNIIAKQFGFQKQDFFEALNSERDFDAFKL